MNFIYKEYAEVFKIYPKAGVKLIFNVIPAKLGVVHNAIRLGIALADTKVKGFVNW